MKVNAINDTGIIKIYLLFLIYYEKQPLELPQLIRQYKGLYMGLNKD